MLCDYTSIESTRIVAAMANALGLNNGLTDARQRALWAKISSAAWSDQDAVAEVHTVAAGVDRHLKGRGDSWRVSASQVADAADVDLTVAIKALAMLGALRLSGKSHEYALDPDSITFLKVIPASVFN